MAVDNDSISRSLERLAALEERKAATHETLSRIFVKIDDIEKTIALLEHEMPTLKWVRTWMFLFMCSALGTMLLAVWKLVLTTQPS